MSFEDEQEYLLLKHRARTIRLLATKLERIAKKWNDDGAIATIDVVRIRQTLDDMERHVKILHKQFGEAERTATATTEEVTQLLAKARDMTQGPCKSPVTGKCTWPKCVCYPEYFPEGTDA